MKILMFTNTFTPHVGGVARSVERFTKVMRERGHHVVVVAPEFEGQPDRERDVVRVPAIQRFNGSDFSLSLPVFFLDKLVNSEFQPDVVHTHHPYLLGDTALRYSAKVDRPLVFTHHTMYEQYTHYVPGDSPVLKRFVVELSTGYANMCHRVIAPSQSVAEVLRERGVETPINVIPTGVEISKFTHGDGATFRDKYGLPHEAYVIGHLGRLAQEKNLAFLTRAVVRYLQRDENSHFLVVGDGPSRESMTRIARRAGVENRLHFTGSLTGQEVVDAYHAMDVFAFASKSETQGMVLTEAMAAGVPVIALDAPGASDVVRDGENGRLLPEEDEQAFEEAIQWTRDVSGEKRAQMRKAIEGTLREFSIEACVEKALQLYEETLSQKTEGHKFHEQGWDKTLRRIDREWDLWSNRVSAVAEAFSKTTEESDESPAGT